MYTHLICSLLLVPTPHSQVGSEFSATSAEQQRQLEALRVLDAALEALALERGVAAGGGGGSEAAGEAGSQALPPDLSGLHVHVYHPDAPPAPGGAGGAPDLDPDAPGYVADDGCVHLVADRFALRAALSALDLDRARLLTRVSLFWLRRARDLTPALTALLGVQNVWCDARTEQNSQNFVIWAGYMLEQRCGGKAGREGGRVGGVGVWAGCMLQQRCGAQRDGRGGERGGSRAWDRAAAPGARGPVHSEQSRSTHVCPPVRLCRLAAHSCART